MLPVLIFVAIAVPLLIAGAVIAHRSRASGEHPVPETEAERVRTEQEFEAAERYQEQWREEHKHDLDHL